MRPAFAVAVRTGFAVRRGMPGVASAPPTGPADSPGPAGAQSLPVTWDPMVTDYNNVAAIETPLAKIEYSTDGGATWPYWKYFTNSAALAGTITGLASGTYTYRARAVWADGTPGNPSFSPPDVTI